jgi:hypothetical protein
MRRLISYGAACALALTLLSAAPGPNVALAQGQDSAAATAADVKREGMNHEAQFHLLAASNEPGGGGNVPPSMEGVIRQLRAALPFSNYRLATTFLNRVRDGGTVEVSGVGGSPLAAGTANSTSPTFFHFSLSNVRLFAGADDQQFIQVGSLRFGLKVPIRTASVSGEGGKTGYPVIQYQDTGITTQVSVREGTPTVVGTLAASQPGESFILVVTLKRTPTR